MALKRISVFLLFILLSMILETGYCDVNPCKRVDASLVQHGKWYLFSGPDYVAFDPNSKTELNRGTISDLYPGFPAGTRIDAATTLPEGGIALFTGSTAHVFRNGVFCRNTTVSRLYGPGTEFKNGLDAAVRFEDHECISKGCRFAHVMIKEDGTLKINKFNLPDFGAPCFLDAAFVYHCQLYMIKGEYLWTMGRDLKLSKPFCLANFLKTDYEYCKCRPKGV